MADIVLQHNIGAYGDLVNLADQSTATAGGAGNGVAVTGLTIDRMGFSTGSMPRSALFGVAWKAAVTNAKTLAIAYVVQHSPDGSTWTTLTSGSATVLTAGSTTTFRGCYNVQVDLNSAQRYVRYNYTPTLNNTATDTFAGAAVGFVAGFDRLAAPNT